MPVLYLKTIEILNCVKGIVRTKKSRQVLMLNAEPGDRPTYVG